MFNLDNEEATQGFAYYTNRAVNDMLQNLNASAENWLLQHFRYIFNDGNITWWQIVQVSYFKYVLHDTVNWEIPKLTLKVYFFNLNVLTGTKTLLII